MKVSRLSRISGVVIRRPVFGSPLSRSRSRRSGTARGPSRRRPSMAASATRFISRIARVVISRDGRGTHIGAPRISSSETLAVSEM